MTQAGLLDVLTVLATALWALAGMVCIHAAGHSRQSREFLLGLGFLAGGVLLGVDLLPHPGALPLASMALLATALWAHAAPLRRDLDGAERLRLATGVLGIGVALHATLLLWPQQPLVFAHWRAVELPVAAALTFLALRTHRLPLHTMPSLRPQLPLALGAAAGACILMARGEPLHDLGGTALLALAPLPLLRHGARVLATRAAVATAGAFVCVLAAHQHDLASRLDGHADLQTAIAKVQRTLRATQPPLDQAVLNGTWQQNSSDYAAAVAAAEAALASLRTTAQHLGVSTVPIQRLAAAMAQHRAFATELLAHVQQRSEGNARTAEIAATVADREAFQALASADAAFADLLQWHRRGGSTIAESAWLTHGGMLSLLLLLAVMAAAAFVATAPAPTPTVPAPLPSPFAGAAHQLRAHLTTMLASAELMVTPDADTDLVEHASTIVAKGQRLATLLDELIDLERLDQRQLSLTSQMFAIDQLCQAILQPLLPPAQARGVGIDFVLSPELPRWVHGDPIQLRRVLTTLLERALSLTPIGNVTLQAAAADGNLEFLISDGGPGLDPAACASFFDRPAGADTARGLSMLFCHRLATAMGGTLRIASEPGHGSELTLQLPLRPAETWEVELEQEDAQQTTAATTPPSRIHGRVLLVEDARDHQLMLGRLIENTGAEVTLADNGEVALQLLQQQSFDLVLMDLQMPGMDGLTATTRLRDADSQTPVVALTADATDADRDKCLAAGCNGHLAKPIDRRTLEQTLAMYLPAADEIALEE